MRMSCALNTLALSMDEIMSLYAPSGLPEVGR